jgi:hypothetical protein
MDQRSPQDGLVEILHFIGFEFLAIDEPKWTWFRRV